MVKVKLVVVEIEAPRWAKRLVAGATAGALMLGASAIVRADINSVKTDFQPGDTLTASDLSISLGALKDAVVQLQTKPTVSVGGTLFSLNGSYVGPSDPRPGAWTEDGLLGYAAGKRICEKKFSKTAHVCDSQEIARSVQAGLIGKDILYPAGAWFLAMSAFADTRPDTQKSVIQDLDCNGHSISSPGGPYYNYGNGLAQPDVAPLPTYLSCDATIPILCCD